MQLFVFAALMATLCCCLRLLGWLCGQTAREQVRWNMGVKS
jgi:hypothetical protein